MGFPRQEHWNGLPFPSPGGLPRPGIEPKIPALLADSLPLAPPGKPQIKQCFAHKKSLKQATASVTRERGRNAFFQIHVASEGSEHLRCSRCIACSVFSARRRCQITTAHTLDSSAEAMSLHEVLWAELQGSSWGK